MNKKILHIKNTKNKKTKQITTTKTKKNINNKKYTLQNKKLLNKKKNNKQKKKLLNKNTDNKQINKKLLYNKNKNKKQNKTILFGGNEEDTDICSKDINTLLSTNKKIFTYNNNGDQTDKMIRQANMVEKSSKSGWGNDPGPPPDPSDCIIS